MHTYFPGWRRKAGCVTLVVACIVMGMWIRSRERDDWVGLSAKYQRILLLGSSQGEIWWQTAQDPHDPPSFELMWWGSNQHGLVPVLPPIEGDFPRAVPTVRVPYWSVAIPLTLASALLILIPSRKRPLTVRFSPSGTKAVSNISRGCGRGFRYGSAALRGRLCGQPGCS